MSWIIDILPKQVPKDSPGQYFAIEGFFLKEQLTEIKKKHIGVILKLNCYVDISIDGEKNPAPERIRDIPSGVIAVGNPCRAILKITEADKEKYPIYRG